MTTPNVIDRHATIQRVRFCPDEQTWQPEDETCGWVHDWPREMRKHRIRRMLICSVCDQAYAKQEDFDGHDCYDAY